MEFKWDAELTIGSVEKTESTRTMIRKCEKDGLQYLQLIDWYKTKKGTTGAGKSMSFRIEEAKGQLESALEEAIALIDTQDKLEESKGYWESEKLLATIQNTDSTVIEVRVCTDETNAYYVAFSRKYTTKNKTGYSGAYSIHGAQAEEVLKLVKEVMSA